MISVIGLGFVGLTTGLGFAEKGYKVRGFDINDERRMQLRDGRVPFYEPSLEAILQKQHSKNFIIEDNISEAIHNSEVIFYCVGTPSDGKGKADLNYLLLAIQNTLEKIADGENKILVVKSTVPPGTISKIVCPYVKKFGKNGITVASNPEFLREGQAWTDFMNPDRVVIGVSDESTQKRLEEIYAPFNSPIHSVSPTTAEFIKYASNSFLATLISFSNEQSMIANKLGDVDIKKSFQILHQDKRWNGFPAGMSSYLYPGCGFGGYCLPKDVKALIETARDNGIEANLLKQVLKINETIPEFLTNFFSTENEKNSKIGILGLSFKANSDDVRESPSKHIIESLLSKGYSSISVYDPMGANNFSKHYNLPVYYASSLSDLMDSAQTLILLTAWDEFKKNSELLKKKRVYDWRYFL